MTIRAEEDSLFQSWRTSRPAVAADGVVSEQDYHASSPSIVVILKEVNDPDGGNWDLRQFLRDGGRSQTWNNVARWVHGIRNRGQDDDWRNQYIDGVLDRLTWNVIITVIAIEDASDCTAS